MLGLHSILQDGSDIYYPEMGELEAKRDKVTRHEWEMVEKYISGQKRYCYKTDTIPVV